MKQPKMRKGAVMMEYVILAVMIAAAALVAIIYFGKTITNQAETASAATAGQSKEAVTLAETAQKTAKAAQEKGEEHNGKFHDQGESKEEGKKGGD